MWKTLLQCTVDDDDDDDDDDDNNKRKNKLTSSVYDCTVEDVEYIYNKLSI